MGLLSKVVVVAGGAYGAWDWLASAASVAEDQADTESALLLDDACELGDSTCAFSALQRHAALKDEAEAEGSSEELDESSTRRRKSKTKDLSKPWERKIYAWMVYIHKNVSLLDWKMFYMKMDMNSTNNSIFHVEGVRGVNGTRVNWKKHPDTWVPTFSFAQEEAEVLPSLAELSAESLLEDAEEMEEATAVSSSRRRGMKGVPPRKAKMQKLMSTEQTRLNNMWHEITMAKRRLNWIGNYMGANRRLYHGRPVLVQKAEALEHENILEVARWSDDESFENAPDPQVELVAQIQMCLNQTSDLWTQLGRLGGMIQAMKHRAGRYRHGKAVNLLEELESDWSHGGYHGYDVALSQIEELDGLGEDEAIADEQASLDELDADWSLFGTTEKCCRCKSATRGWSASGKCSFCKGSLAKKSSVVTECTVKSSKFKGNKVCANMCKKVV